MKTYKEFMDAFHEEIANNTSSVAGAGDDSSTVVMRKKHDRKKRRDDAINVLRRYLPNNTK